MFKSDMIGRIARFYTLTASEAIAALKTSTLGFTSEEAKKRLAIYGPNTLLEPRPPGLLKLYIKQFKNHFIYLLLAASLLSLFIGEITDAVFITVVVQINAIIGAFEEWKAEASALALRKVIVKQATVLRDGHKVMIPSQDLVPGDILFFDSGDYVPADARLLSSSELMVDESLLTGESLAIEKDANVVFSEESAIHHRVNMIYAGTHVLRGRAQAVITQTGSLSEVGKIASSLALEAPVPPPIVVKLKQFTKKISRFMLISVVAIAFAQLLRGGELQQTLLTAVALVVAAIPEGLPIAISVTLAVASHFMSKRNVIIRTLPAVEGLGACTVIASDKTGTLTCNELTVESLYLPSCGVIDIRDDGITGPKGALTEKESAAINALIVAGSLCNEASSFKEDGKYAYHGDQVDVAFLMIAERFGLKRPDLLEKMPEIYAIPYESERKMCVSFNKSDVGCRVFAKGAIETILDLCEEHEDKEKWRAQAIEMARKGYRIIALAQSEAVEEEYDFQATTQKQLSLLPKLIFLGIAGIMDPVRPEVPEAIKACREAGIKVVMITGDHPETAFAIARQLKIASSHSEILLGEQLKCLENNPKKLAEILEKVNVFARIEPLQKLAIVKALQAAGHFVAVTGDGVNDSPALKAANIGIAMGRSGTDVARSTADIILVDDSFASIMHGIFKGRVAYSNIRKIIFFLISTGVAEIVLFLLSIAISLPLPLFAVQLLWLNLVTNGIQDKLFAFEGANEDLLKHPPRSPKEALFDRSMLLQTSLAGATMGVVGFSFFWWALAAGWSEFEARNALLLLFVMFENIHVFNCRSEKKSAFRMPLFANPVLLLSVVAAHGLHIIAMYTPWFQKTLRVEPIDFSKWVLLLALGSCILVVMEAYKWGRRRKVGGGYRNR